MVGGFPFACAGSVHGWISGCSLLLFSLFSEEPGERTLQLRAGELYLTPGVAVPGISVPLTSLLYPLRIPVWHLAVPHNSPALPSHAPFVMDLLAGGPWERGVGARECLLVQRW